MNIAFHTLGCKLNFSETSFIINDIKKEGFKKVDFFNEIADFYVINTCSVTENANKECRYLVRKVQKKNKQAKIIIMGCYAQLKPKEIAKIKGVNLILGNDEKFKLKNYLLKIKKGEGVKIIRKNPQELKNFKSAFSVGDRTRSFLKIQDGCNYKCTFCTIPLARGKSRSDEIENIILKIKKLKYQGIKEVVLTGINIGDFHNEQDERLIDLLKKIDKMDDIRVRISSIEPNLISDEIIQLISTSNVLVPHFHIPLQSGSDTILKSMKRRYLTKQYRTLIKKINNNVQNVCIGVDVIVGFPGEDNKLFEETLSFLNSIDISYLHVFTYSERENTEAIEFKNPVDKKTRKIRSKILRDLSKKKKKSFYDKNMGLTKNVLFENQIIDGYIYGYSENYMKIKSEYNIDLKNTFKKVKIEKIEYNELTCATGSLM